MLKTIIEWIDCHKIIAIATVFEAIVGLGAIFVIYQQLEQSNQLKRFENYNYFNKVYADWYEEMPKEIKLKNTNIHWDKLTDEDRAWIRRYIDLYSEEFYFYKNHMIPKDMWEILIHGKKGCEGAAIINFKIYPILSEGYIKWKNMGAFKHPQDFVMILDEKLKECGISKEVD